MCELTMRCDGSEFRGLARPSSGGLMFETTSVVMKSPSSRQSLKNNRFFNSQVNDPSPSEASFRNRTGCNLDRLLFRKQEQRRDTSVFIQSEAGRSGGNSCLPIQ
jgi:hypothetical protein